MTYEHTQRGWLHLLLFGLAATALVVAWILRSADDLAAVLVTTAAVVGGLGLCMAELTIRDEEETLLVCFGPVPIFRRRAGAGAIYSGAEARVDRHEERERAWLAGEVAAAAGLTDTDRIRILRDLWRTLEAIRRTKPAADLEREEEIRRAADEAGRARYRRLVRRLV